MRIIFMGSPEFAVPSLEVLCNSTHQVIAVVTQPDRPRGRNLVPAAPPVKTVAHRFSIPVLQPVTTKSEIFLEEIRSFHPDLLVVVAYGEILRRTLLDLPPHGAVNLHASLLPKYRGAAPIPWAILNGETITGVTTILINEVMDGGHVLLQEECQILPADTAETLTKTIAHLGAPLLKKTVDRLEKKEVIPQQQDLTQVSYAPKLRKEDGQIDWNKPASWIARQIRAFDPWPGSFSYFRNSRLKFWLAHAIEGGTTQHPGSVIHLTKHSIQIACGEGSMLEVLEIQPANRARLPAADFIHGYSIRPGDRFASSSLP